MASSALEKSPFHSSPAREDADNAGGFEHIPALDGIRGLAILMVLVNHLFWANNITGSVFFDVVSSVCESMYIGVNLFFALSGFLITGILLDTLSTPHFFKTFYLRRALRIFPLYYGVLIVLLLFTRRLDLAWNGWQYFYLTYIANLGFWTGHGLRMGAININHFWSLQVEEQFYLVWPFLLYRVRNLRTLVWGTMIACGAVLAVRVGLVLAGAHLQTPYLVYSATYSCVDSVLFGCCLCILLRTPMRASVLRYAPRVAGVCAVVLIGLAILNGGLRWQKSFSIPTIGFTLLGILSAAVIAMALQPTWTRSFFRHRVLRFFGKYSYGLYVFHPTIAGFLTVPVRGFIHAHLHSKAMGVLASALLVGAASVGAAWMSYHLYEVHFLRLKRYFRYEDRGVLPKRPVVSLPEGKA